MNKRGRDKFNKYKLLLKILSNLVKLLLKFKVALFNSFRMTKGTKGLVIRYILMRATAIYCGDNVSIHPNVYFFNKEKLSLDSNVSIHPVS